MGVYQLTINNTYGNSSPLFPSDELWGGGAQIKGKKGAGDFKKCKKGQRTGSGLFTTQGEGSSSWRAP